MTDCKKWKTGISTSFFKRFDEDVVKEISDSSIDCFELSCDFNYLYDILDFVNKSQNIADIANKYNIQFRSIHLPFSGKLDISLTDTIDRNFIINTNLELIEAAAKAGCEIAVVHPSSEPIADEDRPNRLKISQNSLLTLSDKAASVGMRLAVENLPRTCLCRTSEEMLAILDSNPLLNVCFDTNHSLLQDNTAYINAVASKIITLHVSDYDFVDERHWIPLKGKNNWNSIINALKISNYSGAWVYEVSANGILTPADLFKNRTDLLGQTM